MRGAYFPLAEAPERRAPLWARLTGKRTRDSSYRYSWGEFDPKFRGIALELTGYGEDDRATLIIAFLIGRFFIKLWPGSAYLVPEFSPAETHAFGFSFAVKGEFGFELWLYWRRKVKICRPPWGWSLYSFEYLTVTGTWIDRDLMPRPWHSEAVREDMGEAPWSVAYPYHYMTEYGEAQHVNATVQRSRSVRTWKFFGIPIRRRLDHGIDVEFDQEVGSERGSWKGGCVGCSYTMKPGETPAVTLRRMQRERRFCR